MPEIKVNEDEALSALSDAGEKAGFAVSDSEPAIETSSMAFLTKLTSFETEYVNQLKAYLDVLKGVQKESEELVKTYGEVDKTLASHR
ncbi:YwqI/YxiC family protein [Bacillus sp. JCM 19041]|uniref:YwqI/YxiC family protein n=1 Tax=Bacillus sp. JCM 19041 TaxID=1460637 RepID=UPI0006D152CB